MANNILGSNPLQALDALYQSYQSKEAFPQFALKHFEHEIQIASKDIPLLNSLPPDQFASHKGRLCRFRCMIQDTTLLAEVYAAGSTLADGTKRSNAFHDGLEDSTPDLQALDERTVLFAIEVPAESPWVAKLHSNSGLVQDVSKLNISKGPMEPLSWAGKFPVVGSGSKAVLLKIYDQEESLRSTDVVEVIGILDSTEYLDPASETLTDSEAATPQQTIPTLHALHYSKPVLTLIEALPIDRWQPHRAKLLDHLARQLTDDRVAAEFLLLSILSRIHARKGSALLGFLPLNLTLRSDTKCSIDKLSSALQSLLPSFHTLELTLPVLSKSTYNPTSSNEILLAGQLQLPSSTFLLFDETEMKEGQLQDRGVKNLHSINKVLEMQKLEYLFPFSNFEFETDFGVCVVSKGKSLLPVKCSVPVEEEEDSTNTAEPSEDEVKIWRAQLYRMRACDVTLAEDVSAHIEEDFIKLRKSIGSSIGHEDLMLRMTIARLLALSYGKTNLDVGTYELAAQLDDQRRERVGRLPSAKAKDA